MPRSAEDLGDLKKRQSVEFGTWTGQVDIWGLRNVPRVCWRNCVSLSFLMSKNLKLKKVIKSFVPELISCFSDSYMFMNILWTLCTLLVYVSWSYFWTWICNKRKVISSLFEGNIYLGSYGIFPCFKHRVRIVLLKQRITNKIHYENHCNLVINILRIF